MPETLLKPSTLSLAELVTEAQRLQQAGQGDAAVALYRDFIADGAPAMRHVACFNLGTTLGALNRSAEAEAAYRQAVELQPNFPHARLNLGHLLERSAQPDAAMAQWQAVIASGASPDMRLHAWNNLGRLLETLRRYPEAEAALRESLLLDANQPSVVQHYVHLRQKQCAWPVYQPVGDVGPNKLLQGTSLLAMMSASDDPALQLLSAVRFAHERVPKAVPVALHKAMPPRSGKFKVGYLSGDLHMHAVGLLTPELFELHDREKFEVWAFCWTPESDLPQRKRILAAMDHHVRLAGVDDATAAKLIAEAGIDVLVDLQGLTSGARPAILGWRAAPVQISYLGLPGTSGLPGVDWILADDYVMPPELEPYCTERPIRLPRCYQVSDRQREVAPRPARSSYGLPDDRFVYCSFNNNFKFTPEVFGAWMRILQQVDGSVLWLLADNDTARENMLRQADAHGLPRDRLIFAPRVAPPEYLARFQCADLVLDTFPYNAGTTASDALWMGTPIVTLSGRSYISRMAGSLLTAVGLPDLATTTLADYERLAVTLGRQPARVASYKRYLAEQGRSSPLFDLPQIVRDIESAYERLALQARGGLNGPTGPYGALPPPRQSAAAMSARDDPFLPDAAPPVGLDDDALAQALLWLMRHHGQERSPASLFEGQQIDGLVGPDQAVRALRDAGWNAALVQRAIGDFNDLLLPVVLLLRSGDAALLLARRAQASGPALCTVVMPGPVPQELMATEDELTSEYAGIALVATPRQAAPPRSTTTDPDARADPAGHWLWGTLRRFVPYYRSALLAALLSNTLMLVTGTVTSVIYDKVIPHQAFVTLWALAAAGGLALVFDLTARQLRAYLIDLAGKKADLLVGTQLFRQSLAVRMESRPESAGAYSHIVGQVELVREFLSSATLSAISDLPFIVIFIAMTFVIGGPLGWVLVFAVPAILAAAWLIQGAMRRATSANMQQQADLHGLLVEAVEGIEDIKATGAQGRFLHHYEQSSAAAVASQLRSRRLTSLTMNLSMMSQQAVTLVMLVWGVYLIDAKVITGGALMGGVMFGMRAIAPLTSIVMLATRWQGARAAMVALDKVMAQPTEREPGRQYIPLRETSGRIALADVSFAYPGHGGQESPRVLKNVTLRFEPGERVAILGRIGSGKSTILRIVAGLYRPSEGMVDVDGIDLRQIDPGDFRAGVAYVPQDSRLFNGTLRDNVLLGRPGANPTRLAAVARLTGLARVAESHPLGWDLPVGESGALLSGGQRQLVALTRSLITDPKILLMDEPTSSMDAQSELAFLRQLKEAAQGCTLVMVTHRPAVLELVQRIVVVDAGKVVMDGPKAQVLAALSGAKPAAQAAPAGTQGVPPPTNVHRHPSTQPAESRAAV